MQWTSITYGAQMQGKPSNTWDTAKQASTLQKEHRLKINGQNYGNEYEQMWISVEIQGKTYNVCSKSVELFEESIKFALLGNEELVSKISLKLVILDRLAQTDFKFKPLLSKTVEQFGNQKLEQLLK